jgi:hypothetical protein
MHLHQRQVSAAEPPRRKRWRPEQADTSSDQQDALDLPRVVKSDRYVTIDEQIEGVVSVVAAPWPTVDASGLQFDSDITSTWFDAAELQAVVDGFRAASNQLSRPLRIGDTFWVRGYDESSLAAWRDVRDVTRQARRMARVVVAAVAIGDVDARAYAAVSVDEQVAYDNADVGDRRQNRPPPGLATASPTI